MKWQTFVGPPELRVFHFTHVDNVPSLIEAGGPSANRPGAGRARRQALAGNKIQDQLIYLVSRVSRLQEW